MKRAAILPVTVFALAFAIVGCPGPDEGPTTQPVKMGKCPACGAEAPVGTYCEKCNAVVNNYGEFKCPDCGKTVKAGTYCAKHKKFHFPPEAPKCPKCGKPMGEWCEKCGYYSGLPKVGYDKQKSKPCTRADVL